MLSTISSLFGLIVTTALAFSVLILTNHFIGFYTALALYQFTAIKEVSKYLLLLSGASWLMMAVNNELKIKWNKSLLWVALFIIWAAFSIIISIDFPKDLSLFWTSTLYSPYFLGWNNIIQLIATCFIFIYVFNIISNEKILLNVLRILIICGTIVCMISLIVWFSNVFLQIHIILPLSRGGIMNGANIAFAFEPLAFANQILVVLPLITFVLLMREETILPMPITIVVFIIQLAALISTSSVGGLASYFITTLIVLFMARDLLFKKKILASLLIVITLFVCTYVYLKSANEKDFIAFSLNKITRGFFATNEQKYDRAANNESLLKMFKDNPIAGVGFGNFAYSYKYYSPNNSPQLDSASFKANNDWFTILGETGVVGFVIFFIFITSILYRAYKSIKRGTVKNRKIIIALMASNLAIWLQALGGYFIQCAYAWAMLAILLAAININKKSSANNLQNIKNENSN